jgi:hypothetical protein
VKNRAGFGSRIDLIRSLASLGELAMSVMNFVLTENLRTNYVGNDCGLYAFFRSLLSLDRGSLDRP